MFKLKSMDGDDGDDRDILLTRKKKISKSNAMWGN